MNRRTLSLLMGTLLSLAMLAATPLVRAAADEAPDALIKRISVDVLDNIKADKAVQAGDISRVISLVDSKIMPSVDFTRMTASAVGRTWRQATPEQQKRLQDEFKTLLIRTYSGALRKSRTKTSMSNPCAMLAPQTLKLWCVPKLWAAATRFSWITAWKNCHQAGKFMI